MFENLCCDTLLLSVSGDEDFLYLCIKSSAVRSVKVKVIIDSLGKLLEVL